MSNYQGRKSEFTPPVYTRYFEHSETPKSAGGHIYFNDDTERTSTNYQTKRDLIFKRLFPSKYANSNDKETEPEQIHQNGTSTSSDNTAQALGDFIPLSNGSSSTLPKNQSFAEPDDIILSSSDEVEEDDLMPQRAFPTSTHESVVGHLHPRATITNVRAILIRELYERTSDPHTEWLKCKMDIPQAYINPKYYADFQRRYRKDIQRNTIKTKTSISKHNISENGYHVLDSTTIHKTTIQIDNSLEDDSIIETSPTKPISNTSLSTSMLLSNDSPKPSTSFPEFIILDSDEDEDVNDEDDTKSKYFIDRSAISRATISRPTSTTNEEAYHEEDSKYAQLPSRNKASAPVIRPILSKKQRRKQNTVCSSSKPLVSAIDRIIDHMDQSDSLEIPKKSAEEKTLLKKRKKKKKQKVNISKSLIA